MATYSPFHKLVQKLASSKVGAWYFSGTQHKIDGFFLRLTDNKRTLTSILTGLPVVMLTSIGAKSGKPRTVPLLCIRNKENPAQFAVIASNWGQAKNPAWYYNLRANPEATGAIQGKTDQYIAHEADGAEYEAFWQTAVDTYIGFPEYKKRVGDRHIPIMVLTPKEQL